MALRITIGVAVVVVVMGLAVGVLGPNLCNDGSFDTYAKLIDVPTGNDKDCDFFMTVSNKPNFWTFYYTGPTGFEKVELKRPAYNSQNALKFETTADFNLAFTTDCDTNEVFRLDLKKTGSNDNILCGFAGWEYPYVDDFAGGSLQVGANFAFFRSNLAISSTNFMRTTANNGETFTKYEQPLSVVGFSTDGCDTVTAVRKPSDTGVGSSQVPIGPFPTPGTYTLCVSKDGGGFFVATPETVTVASGTLANNLVTITSGFSLLASDNPQQVGYSGGAILSSVTTATAYVPTGTSCATVQRYGYNVFPRGNSNLLTRILSPGVYDLCLSLDLGETWMKQDSQQVTVGTQSTLSISYISPTTISTGQGAVTFSIAGPDLLDGDRAMLISTGVCSGAGFAVSGSSPGTFTQTVAGPGVHTLCFSHDVTAFGWTAIDGARVAVNAVAMGSTSFGPPSPLLVIGGPTTEITLPAAPGSQVVYHADLDFRLCDGSCSVCSFGNSVQSMTGPTLSLNPPSGNDLELKACFRENGGVWSETGQTLLLRRDRAPTDVIPRKVGMGPTAFSFPGIVALYYDPFTRVGFTETSGNCGSLVGEQETTTSGSVPFPAWASPGTKWACVKTGGNGFVTDPTWSIEVFEADANSVTGLTPLVVVRDTEVFFDVQGLDTAVSTLEVRYVNGASPSSNDCATSGRTLSLTGPTLIERTNNAYGTYSLCVRYSDADAWAPQAQEFTLVQPTAIASFVAVAPVEQTEFFNPGSITVNVDGPNYTPTAVAAIALARKGTCDDPASFVETAPFVDNANTAMSIPAQSSDAYRSGLLTVCATSDGVDWRDLNRDIKVLYAAGDFITSVSVTTFLNGSDVTADFVAVPASPNTRVGLAPVDSRCLSSVTNVVTVSTATTTLNLGPQLNFGTFVVCLSVDGGATYVPQQATVFITSDISATTVTTFAPNVIGAGTTPSLTVTFAGGDPGTNAQLGFSTFSDCSGMVGVTNDPFATLGSAINTPDTYYVCHYNDLNGVFTAQINGGVFLQVVEAGPTSITAIFPPRIAISSGETLTLTGLVDFTEAGVGFTQSNCAARVADAGTISGNTYTLPAGGLPSTGNWFVCYTTNGGVSWELQAASVDAIEATTDSITNVTPDTVGVGADTTVSFAGLQATPTSMFALALASGGPCSGATRYNEQAVTADTDVVIDDGSIPDGNYRVCYLVDGGWVDQSATLRVITAEATTVTGLGWSVIGANTLPTFTFVGAVASATTAIAFATDGACASTLYGITPLPVTTNRALGAAIPIDADDMDVCYTVTYGADGEAWVRQTGPTLTVEKAQQGDIVSLTPAVFDSSVTSDLFNITGAVVTGSSFVAFVRTSADCNDDGKRYGTTAFNGNLVTLASPVGQTSNTMGLCYSTDGGLTYAFQTAFTVAVVSADVADISLFVPNVVGAGTDVSFTIIGAAATSTTRIGLGNSDCTVVNVDVAFPVLASVDLTLPATGGDYTVCYATNGVNFVPQLVAPVTVETAETDSFAGIFPTRVGNGVDVDVDWVGGPPTSLDSMVAFGSADCSALVGGPWVYDGAEINVGTLPVGDHTLCFSVNGGGSYVPQASATLSVVTASTTEVATSAPLSVAENIVVADFGFALAGGANLTANAEIAFSAVAGNCDMANRLNEVPVASTTGIVLPLTFAGGVYTICFSYGADNFAPQANVGLTVVSANPGDITAVTPLNFASGSTPTITFTGAVATATTMVAFALDTECGTTGRLATTPYTVDGPLTLAGPLNIQTRSANLTVCYSVNGGSTWVQQSDPYIYVTDECSKPQTCSDCAENTLCTWCLSGGFCSISLSAASCPVADHISFDEIDACPALEAITPGSGAAAGESNVTFELSRFARNDGMECQWDYGEGQPVKTAIVVQSETTGSCLSPPRAFNAPAVALSILLDGFSYASGSRFFVYYDCAEFGGSCVTCASAASAPECGYCLGSRTCQVERFCNAPGDIWADAACPAVDAVAPPSVLWSDDDVTLTVTGSDFVNNTALACAFDTGAAGGGDIRPNATETIYAAATWVDSSAVACVAPAGDPETTVAVGVVYGDGSKTPYAVSTAVLAYADDPDPLVTVAEPLAPWVIPVVVAGLVLLLCLVGVMIFCVFRRRKRETFLPPKLTAESTDQIVFGNLKIHAQGRAAAAHLAPLANLLLTPDLLTLFMIADVTQSTEADLISKSLAIVFERHNMCVEAIKGLITREVALCTSESTLFRTNSFATKMFKTFSKLVGVHYVHETLGYVLNYNLHKYADTNFDLRNAGGTESDTLAKFHLLSVCQRVFVAIVKSQDSIPMAFRDIFSHVRHCMVEKFPISVTDLAGVVAGNLNEFVMDTGESYTHSADAFEAIKALQTGIVPNPDQLFAISEPLMVAVDEFTDGVLELNKHCKRMEAAFDDLEGAMDPDSAAARRLLLQHSNKQNSIAVGGFYFLRFLVPAITAPEAYRLVREIPSVTQRQMLVLVGKVLQNLSNGKSFGGKEAYMVKLNDFIESNSSKMSALFDELSQPVGDYVHEPFAVDDEKYNSAMINVFRHVVTNYDKIMALYANHQAADAREAQLVTQMGSMFAHAMDQVRQNIGTDTSCDGVTPTLRR